MNPKLPKNLKKYAGLTIAIVDGKVIAAKKDGSQAYEIAKKKYPSEKITLFSLRRKQDKYLLV